jgi:hypothetical protein
MRNLRGQTSGGNWSGLREQSNRVAGPTVAPAVAIPSGNLPTLNETEAAFERLLDLRKRAGEIREYMVHPFRFVLAPGKKSSYLPDFLIVENDGTLTIVEIKGFEEEDAVIKFKWAQEKFPIFRFQMIARRKGIWVTTRD